MSAAPKKPQLVRQVAPASAALDSATRTLELECEGLSALKAALQQQLGQAFGRAVQMLARAKGRVIVTGIGKSGHVGQKLAATFASTGTPAFFVHPSEASHGDLGMIAKDDAIVAISWSGETVEIGNIVTYSRRFKVPLVAITSRTQSALGKQADVVLELPRVKEACPHGLAPTTSTTMMLALGDALAVALMERKGFSADQYRDLHPGGSLGRALIRVSDLMHGMSELPLASEDASMREVLLVMAERRFGCVGLVDAQGGLTGIITDGDLSRHIDGDGFLVRKASAVMTRNPKIATPGQLAAEALAFMNEHKITRLFVLETGARKPVGILHIHDCLRAGIA